MGEVETSTLIGLIIAYPIRHRLNQTVIESCWRMLRDEQTWTGKVCTVQPAHDLRRSTSRVAPGHLADYLDPFANPLADSCQLSRQRACSLDRALSYTASRSCRFPIPEVVEKRGLLNRQRRSTTKILCISITKLKPQTFPQFHTALTLKQVRHWR